MRRRLLTSNPGRAAAHPAARRALRRAHHRAHHRAYRHILKDTGPTLRDICSIVSTYLRLSKAYDKKWHPPSRFKTIGTPEERQRQVEQDLDRIYGSAPDAPPLLLGRRGPGRGGRLLPVLNLPRKRQHPCPRLQSPVPQPSHPHPPPNATRSPFVVPALAGPRSPNAT